MQQARIRLVFWVQVVVLHLSYAANRLVPRTRKEVDWIVGPYEVASLVYTMARALPSAESVVLARHPFYSFDYDWQPQPGVGRVRAVLRAWLLGPAILGHLAVRAQGFVYVSAEGFLNAAHDQRHYEFRFLKQRGLRVVCFFTGSDIRSPKLMKELEVKTGKPNLGTYLREVDRVFASDHYDEVKRAIANAANAYADVVFTADVDQRGYLTVPTHPCLYFFPDDEVATSFGKFAAFEPIVIVHAPSSPIIKGTQLVRAAIAELRAEGYSFEYVELTGRANADVKVALERAHISLNEFYSSVPGVFGVESLAAGCALLTSADEADEPQLPPGSNQAWVVTAHHQVTTNLRWLLDHPGELEAQARAGVAWVRENAAASVTGPALDRILNGR
jgi:hypothetical protein